jgi:hypothetical protein
MLKAYQQSLYQILGLNIKAFRKGIFELFDLLPSQIFRETLESKPASDHLVYYTTQSPEVGATKEVSYKLHKIELKPSASLFGFKQFRGYVLSSPHPRFRSLH